MFSPATIAKNHSKIQQKDSSNSPPWDISQDSVKNSCGDLSWKSYKVLPETSWAFLCEVLVAWLISLVDFFFPCISVFEVSQWTKATLLCAWCSFNLGFSNGYNPLLARLVNKSSKTNENTATRLHPSQYEVVYMWCGIVIGAKLRIFSRRCTPNKNSLIHLFIVWSPIFHSNLLKC